MKLHISIHDTSPTWRSEIEQALALCHARHIKPALLVVPNLHGEAPLLEHADFAEHLRSLQKEGHEMFLHGYFHKATATEAERGTNRVRWYVEQRLVSNREAEFGSLSAKETRARLQLGETVMCDAGLTIDGFVPPAWTFSASLLEELTKREYAYTEDHLRIFSPKKRARQTSLVLNFASRSKWRIASTAAFVRLATRLHPPLPTRIAIHPTDLRVPFLLGETERLLDWAATQTVVRATDLFDEA